jgi:predicted PurR-regulated permease PerM
MQQDVPNSLSSIAPESSAGVSVLDRVASIVGFAVVLALLYFGRGVLIPFTVALMLSLLITPLVRALRQTGLGQTASVLAAVLASALAFTVTAALIGAQFLRMAESLPRYEETIQQNLRQLDELALGRLDGLTREASRLIETHGGSASSSRVPVEVHEPPANRFQIFTRVTATVWPPIETSGIILMVLVFVLLEHEALRDRFIRLAGSTNIRLTTLALNDAGDRLSRFFVSQFAVNVAVGAAIALGLSALGLPNAMLWGALAAVLRFVPYIGIWSAALVSTALAIAVAPGWSLAMGVLGIYVLVELIAAQAVEPHLYGHATGLSPLSIVLAAIFWSAIWGPTGLILSTPLTLCLLVIGRHITALSFLELLLADSQALTPPQGFYQRVLSGDADEIIATARTFLKRNSFAEYCDRVLIPALHLGHLDFAAGVITQEQQIQMRNAVVAVVSALAGRKPWRLLRPRHSSVLDDLGPGTLLRRERERLIGRWQGPVEVPPGSVVLCIGMSLPAHILAAELLVRALREQQVDARHISIEDLDTPPPPGANPLSVAIVYLVSAFPSARDANLDPLFDRVRQSFPSASVVTVLPARLSAHAISTADSGKADYTVNSLVEATQIGTERLHAQAEAL